MDYLKFFGPPAIGAVSAAKFIISRASQEESLGVGLGCLAIFATSSYFICSKYSSAKHTKKGDDEERSDLEDILKEQRSIKYQIQCASVCSATFLSTVYASFSLPSSMVATPGLRLALSARCLSLPGLVLAAAVINVGLRRYPDPKRSTAVTDGAEADSSMRIPLSFLQNTLEQLVIHILASIGLAVTLPAEAMQLVPAVSVLWVVGRIIYYFTYSYLPVMRAFGFSMAIGPSVASMAFTTISALRMLV